MRGIAKSCCSNFSRELLQHLECLRQHEKYVLCSILEAQKHWRFSDVCLLRSLSLRCLKESVEIGLAGFSAFQLSAQPHGHKSEIVHPAPFACEKCSLALMFEWTALEVALLELLSCSCEFCF
jgi:hypothetical protein